MDKVALFGDVASRVILGTREVARLEHLLLLEKANLNLAEEKFNERLRTLSFLDVLSWGSKMECLCRIDEKFSIVFVNPERSKCVLVQNSKLGSFPVYESLTRRLFFSFCINIYTTAWFARPEYDIFCFPEDHKEDEIKRIVGLAAASFPNIKAMGIPHVDFFAEIRISGKSGIEILNIFHSNIDRSIVIAK